MYTLNYIFFLNNSKHIVINQICKSTQSKNKFTCLCIYVTDFNKNAPHTLRSTCIQSHKYYKIRKIYMWKIRRKLHIERDN